MGHAPARPSHREPPLARRLVDPLLALALAALLAVGLLRTAWPQLDSAFLGIDFVDHHGTQWFYWLAERSVLLGESPLHTDLFFHPWGKDVLGHTGANLLDAYLALPFRLLLGPVLGYNVFVLVGLLLGGLAFVPLARQVTDDRLAIGIGAVLLAFLPYSLFELVEGRPTQALLALPVLFLAALLATGRRRGLGPPLLAGLLLALCGYQYWYYAFFGGFLALAHGLWLAARPLPDSGGRRATLARHALVALVAVVLVLPVAVPLMLQMDQVPGLLDVEDWGLGGAPPSVGGETSIGLMLWQPWRGEAGFFVQEPVSGANVFLQRARWTPVVLLPLLLGAFWRPPAGPRLPRGAWVAMCLATAILALGPMVIVGTVGLPNPVYIAVVKLFSPLARLWWPGRAYAFLGPLLVLGAVVGLATARRWGGPWLARALAVGLVGGQAWHLRQVQQLPYPAWDATVPAGYRCLAHGPPGAIVELPYSWTQAHLYYQTFHGRPMLGGMIENNPLFTPPELTTLRQENSFVAHLLASSSGGLAELPALEPADRQAFLDLGYRYVVLQEDALVIGKTSRSMLDNAVRGRAREMRRTLVELAGSPVYDDARVSIYDLHGGGSPCEGQDIEPDRKAVGRQVKGSGDLVQWSPEETPIHWIFEEDGADRSLGSDPRELLWGGEGDGTGVSQ